MIYAKIEFKRKVDWQIILTRNKEDKTEYTKADIPDNFNFFWQNVGVGPTPDACKANQNTVRSTKSI